MTSASHQRFTCSRGGTVGHSRQRLRSFLLMLALVTFAVALVAAIVDRWVPSLLAVAAGLLALFARRMSTDLDPLWIDLEGTELRIQMRRQHQLVSLVDTTLRRLDATEIAHLATLATTAGITAGTGGFESHLLGELDLYATRLENAVLIEHEENATVVTPDDPEAFLVAAGAAATGDTATT
jgi:hypothetical protein